MKWEGNGNGGKGGAGDNGKSHRPPRSSSFHSLQSLICVRSSAKEASTKERGAYMLCASLDGLNARNPDLGYFI